MAAAQMADGPTTQRFRHPPSAICHPPPSATPPTAISAAANGRSPYNHHPLMSSNHSLGPWSIGERVGSSVWIAEDTRSGKKVALKLLTRTLPKDPGRRETMIRDVRVAAALYHSFLVPIVEIEAVGDTLVMIMEIVEGSTLTQILHGQPLERAPFFRFAHQLASVVKYLHTKMLLHGNINGDAVLITHEGQVKLGGLNLANLVRREKTSAIYQQKGGDPRAVAYMAPEQIASHAIDERTDIFSTGVLFFEAATGKLPFAGENAADIARAVVESQPISPRGANPDIDKEVLGVLGACLFKDPFKRIKDTRALVDMIEKAEPQAAEFSSHFEKRPAIARSGAHKEQKQAILFIADVAGDHDEDVTRMQQILGESVYLFDGKVIDPFGRRLVAELPSVESALEAGRKGEFDLDPENQTGDVLQAHLLLHAGEIEMRDGEPVGPAMEKAIHVLEQLPPNALYITEDFVREGRGNVRFRDAGARAGVKLFTIVPSEPVAAVQPTETSVSTAELDAEAAAEQAALVAKEAAQKRKGAMVIAVAAIVLIAIIGGAVLMWNRRSAAEAAKPVVAAVPQGPQPATAANPRRVFVAPFTVDATPDPALADRAKAIQLGTIEILKTFPELRVTDAQAADADSFSAHVRAGAAGAELVPTAGAKSGQPVAMLDVASGIRAMVQYVTTTVQTQPRTYAAADALNSFADAVVARSLNDSKLTDAKLRQAMGSDPNFLPAQLMAMQFFTVSGKPADALAAAKQVIALDPSNLAAARNVARAMLMTGDLQETFAAYDLILKRDPNDAEGLNLIARYAASAGDTPRFNAMLTRLRRVPAMQVAAHEPDLIAQSGRINAAIPGYYKIEESVPNNPVLSLKIGRLSVLRHSLEIADLELKKLMTSDPLYGYHMLSAYIGAEKKDRETAMKELSAALEASVPGDDSWTYAAEVHTILNDTAGSLAALQKATARKEPSASYVLANPLFGYLANDSKFQNVRAQFTKQQEETKAALAQVR
jgi:tetratricopeptide (TPR) repeat protein